MNLKDYKMQPDEGLFEKIERRLKVRRMARVGGTVAAVVAASVIVTVAPARTSAVELQDAVGEEIAYLSEPQRAPEPAVDQAEQKTEAVVPAVEEKTTSWFSIEKREAVILQRETEIAKSVVEGSPEEPVVSRVPQTPQEKSTLPLPSIQEERPMGEIAYVDQAEDENTPEVAGNASQKASKAGDPSSAPVHIDNLLWAPNVIVPNSDVDENRSFKLKLSSTVTNFHIHIYNRGGRLVFTSTDPSFVWDGTHNGSVLPQGAYVWVAQFRDTAGRPRQEKGTITIIR